MVLEIIKKKIKKKKRKRDKCCIYFFPQKLRGVNTDKNKYYL